MNRRAFSAIAVRVGVGCLVLALLGSGGLVLTGLAQAGRARDMELQQGLSREAAQSAARKLGQVREAAVQGRSFGSLRISEAEANSYLQYQMLPNFPPGVSRARLKFHPERLQGSAQVDFEKLREAFGSPENPLIGFLLRGTHTLGVEGTFSSSGGIGQFQLQAVTLDEVTLPRAAVDFLIEQYLKPSYPEAAIDRPFRLPFSIDTLSVEEGSIVLVGRPPDRL